MVPTYFRVVGEGAQSPEPIETVVSTASAAQAECGRLRRICGRYGRVEVWGKDGRRITPERLQNLALAEQGVPAPGSGGAGAARGVPSDRLSGGRAARGDAEEAGAP
jgi:hypothetical protein